MMRRKENQIQDTVLKTEVKGEITMKDMEVLNRYTLKLIDSLVKFTTNYSGQEKVGTAAVTIDAIFKQTFTSANNQGN
jgi:hypothetical protein